MANDIYLIGEVGYEVTLQNVIEAVKKSDQTKPLNVNIHSGGGSVYDGLAIYNYLKGLEQEVNTISTGLVASISSIIFLAGQKETRKMNRIDNFLIHLPMGFAGGNAKDLEKTAKEMREIENKLSEIYAKETELSKDEALELMKKDEMLDVDFLKEKGFVNEIVEFKAVANFNNREMNNNLTKEEAQGMFAKFEQKLKAFFKPEIVNKLVQDVNGVEINFTDLAEDEEVVIGKPATVDGAPANGEYIMPSEETYVFVDGSLTEINEVEQEEEEEEEEDIDALKQRIAELEAEKTDFENKFDELSKDFTELKNGITSDFQEQKRKKKEDGEPKNRTLRNKKK